MKTTAASTTTGTEKNEIEAKTCPQAGFRIDFIFSVPVVVLAAVVFMSRRVHAKNKHYALCIVLLHTILMIVIVRIH